MMESLSKTREVDLGVIPGPPEISLRESFWTMLNTARENLFFPTATFSRFVRGRRIFMRNFYEF